MQFQFGEKRECAQWIVTAHTVPKPNFEVAIFALCVSTYSLKQNTNTIFHMLHQTKTRSLCINSVNTFSIYYLPSE